MPNLHPNMNLEFDLDSTWDSPETRQEIKRSCAFIVGSIDMRSHGASACGEGDVSEGSPAGEGDAAEAAERDVPENNLSMNISLHMPYWDAREERSRANWPSFESWLDGKLRKVSNALVGINGVRARKGDEPFPFSWLTMDMKGHVLITVHLACDSSVDEGTVDMVANVRELMGANAWGDGVGRVVIPSRTYFESQLDGAMEAERTACEERGAEEDPRDDVAREGDSPDGSLNESDAPEEREGGDESAAEGDVGDSAEGSQEDLKTALQKAVHPAMPSFSIDYGIWDIEYTDGSTAVYDSVSGVLSRG